MLLIRPLFSLYGGFTFYVFSKTCCFKTMRNVDNIDTGNCFFKAVHLAYYFKAMHNIDNSERFTLT